jgi:hypothetical protein
MDGSQVSPDGHTRPGERVATGVLPSFGPVMVGELLSIHYEW